MVTFTVREERDELLRLHRHYEGTEYSPRLAMLLLYLDQPQRSTRSIATDLKVPESTLRRWRKIYCDSGLNGLLQFKGRGKRASYTLSSEREDRDTETSIFSTSLYDFLNNFPVSSDPMEWSKRMQQHLVHSFDAVDYALVCVSLIDTRHPEENRNSSSYQQIALENQKTGRAAYKSRIVAVESRRPFWKTIVEDFQQVATTEIRGQNLESSRVGEPVGFDYYLHPANPNTYMGSIVMLHDTRRGRFPAAMIHTMEELSPFFRNQFLQHINTVNFQNPLKFHVGLAMPMLSKDLKLTNREEDVLTLLLHGHSYMEVANTLNISSFTVASHVHQIYQKAQVSRLSELFARLLTSRYFVEKGAIVENMQHTQSNYR